MNTVKFMTLSVLCISLAGCHVIPKKPDFPKAIPELTEKCPELKKIEAENISITDMIKIVSENYTFYYDCANKVAGWNKWYVEQKKINEK